MVCLDFPAREWETELKLVFAKDGGFVYRTFEFERTLLWGVNAGVGSKYCSYYLNYLTKDSIFGLDKLSLAPSL